MTKDKTTVKHSQDNQSETFEDWENTYFNHEVFDGDYTYQDVEAAWDHRTTKHQAEIKEKDKKISELERYVQLDRLENVQNENIELCAGILDKLKIKELEGEK